MKKTLILSSFIIFNFILLSCKSDVDDLSNNTSLSGTFWVKINDDTRTFTFTSSVKYVYTEYGNSYPGTYTFDGSFGTFDGDIDFKVNGDILSSNQDDSNQDFESLYAKQN